MMRILKWAAAAASAAVAVLAAFAGWAYVSTGRRLDRRIDVPAPPFTQAVAKGDPIRGKRLAEVRLGCVDCHGDDLGGGTVVDAPPVAHLFGSNITSAALKDWTEEQVARAIRSGVSKDGRPLLLMPSQDYQYLSEKDLADLTAYLRQAPPVDKPTKPSSLGPVFTLMYALGKLPTLTPVDIVDHARPFAPAVAETASPEFGGYLVRTTCMGCHGEDLKGGPIPGGDPKWPPAAPITKDAIGVYTEASFVKMLRTGKTPGGTELRRPMVIRYTAQFTDIELKAIWAYLDSLPSTEL